MLTEFDDMLFLCRQGIQYLFWFIRKRLLKHLITKVIGTFLILTIYILLFSHVSACIFILSERLAFAKEGSDLDPYSQYVSAIYFMVTTSTSVGYGDITIDHSTQILIPIRYLYQVFLMLVSLVVNSAFYSFINMTVDEAIYILDKMQEPLEAFDLWLGARMKQMPSSNRVNKFYRLNTTNFNFSYNFDLNMWVNYLKFLDRIPSEWSDIIKFHSTYDLKTKFLQYFEQIPPILDEKIIFAMRPVTFLQGDIVVERREPFLGIYFIVDGEISVYFRSKANTVHFLSNGDDFGDSCLLKRNSHFSYFCETDVLAMFISYPVLDSIFVDHKDLYFFLKARASFRQRKFKNVLTRIQSLRNKLNPVRRRLAFSNKDSLLDKEALFRLQSPKRKEEAKPNLNCEAVFEKKDLSSSSSSDSESKQSKQSLEQINMPIYTAKESSSPTVMSPAFGRKKRLIKQTILSKETSVKKGRTNQIVPINTHDTGLKSLKVSKNLHLGDIIQIIGARPEAKMSGENSSPFMRLHQALLAGGSQGQTKLIRANSADLKANKKTEEKVRAIAKVITANVAKDTVQHIVIRVDGLPSAQLQKELILASSKTMARERVRDFALSLHKTLLKDEYNLMKSKKQKLRQGNTQKGAVGLQRILAPLLKDDGMDNSLAESTEEEEIEVGSLHVGRRRHLPAAETYSKERSSSVYSRRPSNRSLRIREKR